MNENQRAVHAELCDLLVEKIPVHCGDFDAWLRDEDPDTLDFAYELVESLADVLARPLSRSEKQHRLEALWLQLYRDMAEEYAQSMSWDRERDIRHYADRRGF